MKNRKLSKAINVFSIFICLLLFICGFARTLLSPDDEIIYENRPAEKLIGLDASSYIEQGFQDSMESSLSDQVHAAIKMKKMYNIIDGLISLPVAENIAAGSDCYVGYRDVWFFNDMLVLKPLALDEHSYSLQNCTDSINAHIRALPETDFYIYYIETDKDINLESGEKSGFYEFLHEKLELDDSRISRLANNVYEDYSRNFLSTDHHWNGTGAYNGYLDICRMMGLEPLPSKGVHCAEGKYLGTRAAGIEGLEPGNFDINVFDYSPMQIYFNGNPLNDYGRQSQFVAGELQTISYGSVFGEDGAEIVFDTGKDGKNLLVMGDSYDNAIIKALACGFSKTHSVDLRAYPVYGFDLETYVQEHEIDTVLFIGGFDYFNNTVY